MAIPRDTQFFEEILQYLQQTHGFDFTAYKRPSLMRRLLKRMQAVDAGTFEEYFDYLQVHQEEFALLFNTILINVTSFFRDPEVWTAIAETVLPALIEREGTIRIWSAGCASGQEPYSLAMLLADRIGVHAVRDRIKIYATDVDEEALANARMATYAARELENVKPEWVTRYFEPSGGSGQYTFSRDLRRAVIFGRHDLLNDVPISRVDLLVCRNTLMYFTADAQSKVLARFYFSLNPNGVIVLGRAEMLFSHGTMFAPLDLKRRIFRTVAKNGRDRAGMLAQSGRDGMHVISRLREAAFESGATAQIVLDHGGVVAFLNEPARARFGLTSTDIGRPLQDLELSYRPAELRGLLDKALVDRAEVSVHDVHWTQMNQTRIYNITVTPLYNDDASLLGTRISFFDVTEFKSLESELQHSKQELETAYEELQSTNEELETTNEELQSTIEELETTNEELQSTNEELETMNEELQSANEELQTINDELRNRSTDLNSAHAFLESVFTSLRSGVVVVDRDLRVQVWNHRAEDLWGVRATEAQQANFLGLDIGLPVNDLRSSLRDILAGTQTHAELLLPATSRRGKPMECRVTLAPLRDSNDGVDGVILLMDERRTAEANS